MGSLSYFLLLRQDNSPSQPLSTTETDNSDAEIDEIISSGTVGLEGNILVLLETYKKPQDTLEIYRLALDGSGEKKLWSSSVSDDYGISRIELSFPFVNNGRNYLAYGSGGDILIIDANTGEERDIALNYQEFFSVHPKNCAWNHQNNQIVCLLQNDENDKLLLMIDIQNGEEVVLGNSLQNPDIFPDKFNFSLLGWDKDDKNIILFGLRTEEHASFLFTINVESKKVDSVKIAEGRLDDRSMKFSSQLNKLIYASEYGGIASLYMFDPVGRQTRMIYQHPDYFIKSALFFTSGEKYVIFQEDNFTMSFVGGTLPRDGIAMSKIVKVNLENGQKQEFDYPFDPQDSVFFQKGKEEDIVVKGKPNFLGSNLVFYHQQQDTLVVENAYFFGENLDEIFSGTPEERQGEKVSESALYSYNLNTGKLTKIFSRSNTDYPNSEFQFGVIP